MWADLKQPSLIVSRKQEKTMCVNMLRRSRARHNRVLLGEIVRLAFSTVW